MLTLPQRLEVGEPKAKKSKGGAPSKGKKSKKDPNAPKRPLSAFMYFSKDQRPAVKAANPDATFGELGKLLAEKWSNTLDKKVQNPSPLAPLVVSNAQCRSMRTLPRRTRSATRRRRRLLARNERLLRGG